ncbi:MAG TPA: hypothetical protein VGU44_03060 [Gammaproteobacteria bacterium]|nr:hypothetical protein [Gammaproteobacteria bacterium]
MIDVIRSERADVLELVVKENPSTEFLVLCGRTHSKAEYNPLDNLIVRAGSAEYSQPEIQDIISL